MSMKIALINQPLGNRGDESAHKAFIKSLLSKFPDAEIDVLFINQDQAQINAIKVISNRTRYVNIVGLKKAASYSIKLTMMRENLLPTYLHPLLKKYRNIIKKYDYIICAPGGICMGGFMNWTHIWQLYVAMRLHKEIIYWARSIGPFTDEDKEHHSFKEMSYKLINNFKYISLRDDVSYQLAKYIRPDCKRTVDSAFLSQIMIEVPEKINNMIGSDQYIVFVPNELTWHYKFKYVNQKRINQFYIKIIELITDIYPGKRIVMLPQTCKSKVNDYEYFLELKDESKYKDRIIVIDEDQNSDIQQTIIRKSTFVIGARYHSIIFAINNCVPFLSLSYEHKMRGILKNLGLSSREFDIEDFLLSEKNISDETCNMLREKMQNNFSVTSESKYARETAQRTFDGMVEVLLRK